VGLSTDFFFRLYVPATRAVQVAKPEGAKIMAWFYEIRSSNNAVLKRDGGFATQDAAKTAGREDAKKMKNTRQPDRPDVGTILVGQNVDKPTRY
jgi:hypothetical protein